MRIGIDLGGTKTEGIVMDGESRIVRRERRSTPQADGWMAILENIRDLVLSLERHAGVACTIGIGTPGAVSTRTGRLKNSNTTCLNDQPVHEELERMLERPVRLENDANCFTLSEALDGAGRGEPVVFGVILGTGVGGGIVVHERLIEGLQHIAGEWGHNVLDPDGLPCYCGRRGCIETLISGPGMSRDYRRHGGDPKLNGEEIVRLAERGDAVAAGSLDRYLERFGRAMATVVNILDPNVIVLGGGLSNIQSLYTQGRDHLARNVFNDELRTRIVSNIHGDSSGVRGAAQLWPPS